jgi:hypothetical protein
MITEYYGHQLGSCTKVNNDAIVWIPKCGSSVLRLYYKHPANYHNFDVKKYWVLLRDPYFRWKSGIYEYWFRNPNKEEEILDTINKIEFDEHTVPQTKFLNFTGPAEYLMLEFDGMETLNMNLKLFKTIPFVNYSFENKFKLMFSKKLDRVLSKTLIDKVDEYYHDDYLLIKNNVYFNHVFTKDDIYYKDKK